VSNGQWIGGDPAVGKILELHVKSYAGTDQSLNPVDYEPARTGKPEGKKMIPLWMDRNNPADMDKLKTARRREFEFGRFAGTDQDPWTIRADNGIAYNMDPRRISGAPQLANGPSDAGYEGQGTTEIWKLTGAGSWSHPIHVHFEEGVILRRGGLPPPEWEKWARKDVYRVGTEADSTSTVEFAIHFREFAGTYMEHCHNTQHEDNAMLLRWDIEHPGQFMVMPTPLPSWEGVQYARSVGTPTFRSGAGFGLSALAPVGTAPPPDH
jgi:FtsP/CotA-like multicopper oxidase with cupredoxin domain